MKKSLIYLGILALAAACRGRGSGDSLQREQQQYDVVQEGQTSTAVTSTINAPGEPAAPMTGTNADTTSNFTLPGVAPGTTSTQPGTIAGTLTIPSNSGPMVGYPSSPPRPRPRPRATPRPVEPPRTDTATTSLEGPPPSTSTIPPTTDTAPPPPPRDRDDKKPPADQKPPSTDTQPPPSTTTTG